jgi:hypothetical protein
VLLALELLTQLRSALAVLLLQMDQIAQLVGFLPQLVAAMVLLVVVRHRLAVQAVAVAEVVGQELLELLEQETQAVMVRLAVMEVAAVVVLRL